MEKNTREKHAGGHTVDLKTVGECNRCLDVETLHPQATLIDLSRPDPLHEAVKFEFYAVLLIEDCPGGCVCCGRRYYDYGNATMVFLAPGGVFRLSAEGAFPAKGWLLAFRPELLSPSFACRMLDYSFFHYRKEEALHLSQRETGIITCCLEHIDAELHHPIDGHTATILSRQIELMLDYCARYYERQFITRENKNRVLMERLRTLVDEGLSTGLCGSVVVAPRPEPLAGSLALSPAYLLDLLKFETGQTLAQYVSLRRLEQAKRLLQEAGASPAAVARRLGYPSTQFFSALFKKVTGVAPADYRHSLN